MRLRVWVGDERLGLEEMEKWSMYLSDMASVWKVGSRAELLIGRFRLEYLHNLGIAMVVVGLL